MELVGRLTRRISGERLSRASASRSKIRAPTKDQIAAWSKIFSKETTNGGNTTRSSSSSEPEDLANEKELKRHHKWQSNITSLGETYEMLRLPHPYANEAFESNKRATSSKLVSNRLPASMNTSQ